MARRKADQVALLCGPSNENSRNRDGLAKIAHLFFSDTLLKFDG